MDGQIDWTDDSEYRRIQRDIAVGDQLSSIHKRLVSCESICQRDIVDIEAACPGLIMDTPPSGGYTIEPSQQNYHVTLESLERYRVLLVGSALVAILGFIWRLFGLGSDSGGSGGSGGGSGGGRDFYHYIDKDAAAADAGLKAGQQAANNIQHMATGSASLTAEFKSDAIPHLKLAGLSDDVIAKILTDEPTARRYICGSYLEDVQWHSLSDKLYGIVVEPNYKTEQQALLDVITGLFNGVAERYSYIEDIYVFMDQQIARLRTDQPDHTHPDFPVDVCKDLDALRKYLNAPPTETAKELSIQLKNRVTALKSKRGLPEARAKLQSYHEWYERTRTFIATCISAKSYIDNTLARRNDVSKRATSLQAQLDNLKDMISQWEAGRAPANAANDNRIELVKKQRQVYINHGNDVTLTTTHMLEAMLNLHGMGVKVKEAFADSNSKINRAQAWLVGIETRLRNATTN